MPPVRRLTAILATDVAGYSRLMGADEEGTHERLVGHLRELVDPKISEHRGRIVKNTGDGLLAEFPSVVDAVRCAAEVQRGMIDREPDMPEERRIRFRIGVNLGDIIAEEHDIFGDGVNVAARLEALSEPGGIYVSRVVRDQVRDKLDFVFEDLGDHEVKNIARPVRVYRVRDACAKNPGAPASQVLPLPDKPSLAVLPFENLTGDIEQDYFVDGVVEEITTAISRIPWLFVIARNSSFTYKGRAVGVEQVARELGVRYVLEGSVRKAGNQVRITGQLIDATNSAHIWADRFDGALDNIFELQDQAASRVIGAIEPRLRVMEIERARRKPPESLDTYDLYLRALAKSHKYSEEGMREAIALLKQALGIDPFYVPAAAMIGWCRMFQRMQGWGRLSEAEIAEAIRLARLAVGEGKDDPDALWMAGDTLSFFGGEHATAASVIDRALTLNPNSAHAWMISGWLSAFQDQSARAIEALQRAIRLSPLDPLGWLFTTGLAFAHCIAGQHDKAAEAADLTLRERPHNTAAIRTKVASCAYLGRIEEAEKWLKRLFELQPGYTIASFIAQQQLPPQIRAVYAEGFRKAGMPAE